MMKNFKKVKLNLAIVTICSLILGGNLQVNIPADRDDSNFISLKNNIAMARSSGGRSRGGSFSRRSSSSGSRSSTRNNDSSPTRVHHYYHSSPTYYHSYGYSNTFTTVIVFMILGGIILFIVIISLSHNAGKKSKGNGEIDNNIVTISKLQVALLADAKSLQKQLSEISLNIDTNTQSGLCELLQESVLALLRNPEYWSHVQSNSFSINIDRAEENFNKLSIEERSKFSSETLSNVDGKVSDRDFVTPTDETAAYIVVTLLVGTAHDGALFKKIQTTDELKVALEKLASISSDYLMKFELLWSPQQENDSLTYEELLTEYTNMLQLV